ncbi:hypothetical protein EP7_005237 [Isosphaeraceae bacterium EP7]
MNSTPYFAPKYFPSDYFPSYALAPTSPTLPSDSTGPLYFAPSYYPPSYFPWNGTAGDSTQPEVPPVAEDVPLLEAIVAALDDSAEFGEVRGLATIAERDELALDRLPFLGVIPDGWQMALHDSDCSIERSEFLIHIVATGLDGRGGAVELFRLFRSARAAIAGVTPATDVVPRLTRWEKAVVAQAGEYRYSLSARLSISQARIGGVAVG